MRKDYYSLDEILKVENCPYKIILGSRANGKSYAVKKHCIQEAWEDNENKKFILLRRLNEEIKTNIIEHYFEDMKEVLEEITEGKANTFTIYRGDVYASFYDKEKDTVTKKKKLGYIRCLNKAAQYKSGSYLDVDNIIFEEFIPENNSIYLTNEPQRLQSFISTVARNKFINTFLIGNTISRLSPYFTEWGLYKVSKQKRGTIDRYKVVTDAELGDFITIAVELCHETEKSKSSIFFSNSRSMIVKGEWQVSNQYPQLEKEIEEYNLLYTMVLESPQLNFLLQLLQDNESGDVFWYVEPKTTPIKENTRVISNKFNTSPYYTAGLIPLNENERKCFELIKMDKVCYSNSLHAEEFKATLKQLKNNPLFY